MTATDATELVDQFTPLALGMARRWGTQFPWLLDDLASDASLALWQAAQSWKPEHSKFPTWARKQIRWALVKRLENERAKNPLAFRPQFVPTPKNDLHPLDLAPARSRAPDELAEIADAVANLPALLAVLPENRRALVVRHFANGETCAELAEEYATTRSDIRGIVGKSLKKLRQAARVESP